MRIIRNYYFRSFKIYTLFMKIILSYFLYKNLKRFFNLDITKIHKKNALRIYHTAVKLKGTFLKIGQFLSSRIDLLPEEYFNILSSLHDNVPPITYKKIKSYIKNELGDDPENIFMEFNREPFAAASFSQVYKASLYDGKEIAVKIQFPYMDKLVKKDLKILGNAIDSFRRFLAFYIDFDYASVFQELKEYIPLELDYEKEGENLKRLRKNFRNKTDVVFPEVYEILGSKKVLVTEYLEGIKIIDYLQKENNIEKKDKVLSLMVDAYCQQIFKDGLFQADANPGNFLILEDQKIGMIDFGVIKEFTEKQRRGYLYLCKAIVDRNPEDMARCFKDVGFKTSKGDIEPLIHFSKMFMGIFLEAKEDKRNIITYSRKFHEIVKDNPVVKIPIDFTMLGRVLFTLSGYNNIYHTNINFRAIIYSYFGEVFWDEVKKIDWKKKLGETAKKALNKLYDYMKDPKKRN